MLFDVTVFYSNRFLNEILVAYGKSVGKIQISKIFLDMEKKSYWSKLPYTLIYLIGKKKVGKKWPNFWQVTNFFTD